MALQSIYHIFSVNCLDSHYYHSTAARVPTFYLIRYVIIAWPYGLILTQSFLYHDFSSKTISILNNSFIRIWRGFFQFSIFHSAHLFLCSTINTERNRSSLFLTAIFLSLHNLSDSHWSQWKDGTTTQYLAIWFWNEEA